jgi:MFS family permease
MRPVTHRRLKPYYLVLEALNSISTTLYYYYLFFYMQAQFGYGDLANLGLSALNGGIYTFCAWQAGRFAQRRGYLLALELGVVIMSLAMAAAAGLDVLGEPWNPAGAQIIVLVAWTIGIGFTWASLEALISDHEPVRRLPRIIGVYNVNWAAGGALAYFVGGAMLEHLGARSVFLVPLVLHLAQLAIICRVAPLARIARSESATCEPEVSGAVAAPGTRPDQAAWFLKMAWFANPFAYVASSALIPVIPGLAQRHGLSPTWAGFFCSVWLFARLGAFALLWIWPGWHYRFRWFVGAFVLLIASFATILISPVLWPVFLAQAGFGLAVGLLYYSSLYYSMDAGDTKGEHGGIHEALIGAGIFAGPAIGGAALWLMPGIRQADTWAVSIALTMGLGIILLAWNRRRTSV